MDFHFFWRSGGYLGDIQEGYSPHQKSMTMKNHSVNLGMSLFLFLCMYLIMLMNQDANSSSIILIFYCVRLDLASQKERGYELIILHVWNIISCEFLLFSSHSSCWM